MSIDFYKEALKMQDEMIKDLQHLVSIASVYDASTTSEEAPYGIKCREALDAFLSIGQRDGYEVENICNRAGHIKVGTGENAVGILGHVDVVPVDISGWNTDPFEGVVKDGMIYGRGVADDKGPVLAGYYAAKIIDKLQLLNHKQVRIIVGSDEERGSSCMDYYIEHVETPACSFTPDGEFPVSYAEKQCTRFDIKGKQNSDVLLSLNGGSAVNIVCDKVEAVLNGVYAFDDFNAYLKNNGISGSIEVKEGKTYVNVRGIPAHGSLPERGKNAATYLAHYLNTKVEDEIINYIDTYYHNATNGEKLGVKHTGRLNDLSMNLGIIHYNDSQFELGLDFRSSDEITPEFIEQQLVNSFESKPWTMDKDISNALYVDPNSALVKKLHQAYVDISNDKDAKPQIMGGGTYAKHFSNCVAFGNEFPGHDVHMHEDNEQTLIEDLVKGCAIYAKALYLLLNEE